MQEEIWNSGQGIVDSEGKNFPEENFNLIVCPLKFAKQTLNNSPDSSSVRRVKVITDIF